MLVVPPSTAVTKPADEPSVNTSDGTADTDESGGMGGMLFAGLSVNEEPSSSTLADTSPTENQPTPIKQELEGTSSETVQPVEFDSSQVQTRPIENGGSVETLNSGASRESQNLASKEATFAFMSPSESSSSQSHDPHADQSMDFFRFGYCVCKLVDSTQRFCDRHRESEVDKLKKAINPKEHSRFCFARILNYKAANGV